MVKRLTRRKKKGGSYTFSGPLGSGIHALEVQKQGGEVPAPSYVQSGGKHKKKSRKTRGRKMKGGGKYAGGVFPSFNGTGEKGMANMTPGVSVRGGNASPATFNDYSAKGFGSFKI